MPYSPPASRPRSFYRSLVDVTSLSPQEFEEYVSFLLQELGYKTARRGAVRDADGGVDIDAWQGGRHVLVQCKRFNTSRVDYSHVRDLIGAVVVEKADSGWLVHTGRVTRRAEEAAFRFSQVKLIDLAGINAWQKQAGVGRYLRPDTAGAPAPDCPKSVTGDRLGAMGGFKLAGILGLLLVCGVVWCCVFNVYLLSSRTRGPEVISDPILPTLVHPLNLGTVIVVTPTPTVTATPVLESYYTPQPVVGTVEGRPFVDDSSDPSSVILDPAPN